MGDGPVGAPYEPPLAAEFPVFCCLKEVIGGGVAEALPAPKLPKMSSNDFSPYGLAAGEVKAPMISVLAVRRKNGLFALEVDSAGLATWADPATGDPVLP